MPELPEVETVKRVLENRFTHKIFKDVIINYDKIIANMDALSFKNALINQEILSFSRKGKYLIFNLSNGYLISHLRMEGKYKFDIDTLDKHCHIIFIFQDNDRLIYHDVRKFGKMFYFPKEINIYDTYPLNTLGLEPFEIKDVDYLYEKTKNSKKMLKEILLDQSIIAGIGNIYADEICFASHLLPNRIASTLTKNDLQNIVNNAVEILNESIKDGGSTVKTYQSAHGVDGHFQAKLKVYGKENMPCPICHNLICKCKIGGRGTHYCANCQK